MNNTLRTVICLTCLTFCSGALVAQEAERNHSIGLQLNPYLDEFLYTRTFIKPVFALRYSWKLNNHFSFGPELSGNFIKRTRKDHDYKSSGINIGAFARYSFLPGSRISPFVEASPFWTFAHTESKTIVTMDGVGMDISKNYFNGYISPGFSLFNKSGKISLDLMYKFSNRLFVNGNRSVFSYRLNFNF